MHFIFWIDPPLYSFSWESTNFREEWVIGFINYNTFHEFLASMGWEGENNYSKELRTKLTNKIITQIITIITITIMTIIELKYVIELIKNKW